MTGSSRRHEKLIKKEMKQTRVELNKNIAI